MCNPLKIQKKKYIFTLSIIVSIFSFSSISNSQSRNRKATSSFSRTTKKTSNSRVSVVKNTSSNEAVSTTKQEIDVSTITKYNCEEFYNKCMNKTCYNALNGRCDCNKQSKFDEANKLCEYIINACPSQSKDIVKTFARNASSDCMSFNLAKNEGNTKNINNYLADTIACLRPKCKANKTDEFAGCFDEDNFNSRLEICKNSFKDVSDEEELKKLIKESFTVYKTKYCNDMFGTMKDDGNCYLTIGIGVAAGDIKKTKEFKIGDMIVCSSKAFDTSMGKDDATKLKHIKNVTLAAVGVVSQSLSATAGIVGGNSASALKFMNVVGTAAGATDDVVSLVKDDFSYKGKCFVISNGKPHELFPENEEVAYKLRWAENWSDTIYGNTN